MQEKSHLRTKFKELRKAIDTTSVSALICQNIRDFDLYQKAENVMLFYPTKYEINLLDLLKDNKKFFFPRVNGEDLQVCPYSENVEFKKSAYKINEPCSNPVSSDILDLVLVPALAVDKKGFRLGYGGGFYDRFLSQCKNVISVVPIYDNFILEDIPHQDFDINVDFIISNLKRLTIK